MWAAQTHVPENRTTQSIRSSSFIFFSAARASSFVATTTSCSTSSNAALEQGLLRPGDERVVDERLAHGVLQAVLVHAVDDETERGPNHVNLRVVNEPQKTKGDRRREKPVKIVARPPLKLGGASILR